MQYPVSNSYGYVQASTLQQQQQLFYNASMGQYGAQQRTQKSQMMSAANVGQKMQRVPSSSYQKNNGYQLKVGGVVVGSWANGSRNAQASRMNRAGMVSVIDMNFELLLICPLFRFASQSINVCQGVSTLVIVCQVLVF